jgi:hypothetical protein
MGAEAIIGAITQGFDETAELLAAQGLDEKVMEIWTEAFVQKYHRENNASAARNLRSKGNHLLSVSRKSKGA